MRAAETDSSSALAGSPGVELDLAHGRACFAGCEVHLHALLQPGRYRLDDGSGVRLPSFVERSRCVAQARPADDPADALLQALRALMRDAAETSAIVDGLLLALAGGALQAPPFSQCTLPDEDGEAASALAVDLAAIERAGSASLAGGWRRLVVAPVTLDELIDEMLARLLTRGAQGGGAAEDGWEADEASLRQQASAVSPFPRRPSANAGVSSEAMALEGAASTSIARTNTGAATRATQADRPALARQANRSFANARLMFGPTAPGGEAVRARAPLPEGERGRAVTERRTAWQVHRTPATTAPSPVASASWATTSTASPAGAPAHTRAASPMPSVHAPTGVAMPALVQPQSALQNWPSVSRAQAPFSAPIAAAPRPDALADIAQAIADECDLRGLAP